MNIQAKVALDKEAHPEHFCPERRCLWRTGGGYCLKHARACEDAACLLYGCVNPTPDQTCGN